MGRVKRQLGVGTRVAMSTIDECQAATRLALPLRTITHVHVHTGESPEQFQYAVNGLGSTPQTCRHLSQPLRHILRAAPVRGADASQDVSIWISSTSTLLLVAVRVDKVSKNVVDAWMQRRILATCICLSCQSIRRQAAFVRSNTMNSPCHSKRPWPSWPFAAPSSPCAFWLPSH